MGIQKHPNLIRVFKKCCFEAEVERLELPSPYGRRFSKPLTYQLAYTSSVAVHHFSYMKSGKNAETVGFEPTVRQNVQRLSKPPP